MTEPSTFPSYEWMYLKWLWSDLGTYMSVIFVYVMVLNLAYKTCGKKLTKNERTGIFIQYMLCL